MASNVLLSIVATVLIIIFVVSAYLITTSGTTEFPGLDQDSTSEPISTSETLPTDAITTTNVQRRPDYYFSAPSYTWEDARSFCRTITKGAKLAEFQSEEEYRVAVNYIMRNTAGGRFWIGGIYKRSRWEWADGGLVDESISDWPSPTPRPTSASRLSILLRTRLNVYWNCLPKNESIRLLCQM